MLEPKLSKSSEISSNYSLYMLPTKSRKWESYKLTVTWAYIVKYSIFAVEQHFGHIFKEEVRKKSKL